MRLGVNVDPEQLISRLLDGMIAWKKNRSKKAMRVETVRVNEKRKLKVGLVDFVKVMPSAPQAWDRWPSIELFFCSLLVH